MSKEDDESTILSKLRVYFPDGLGSNGYTTNFVKISSLKKLKINVYSDTDVKLNFEWSIDGINRDMIQEMNIESNKWYNEKIRILMEYVRLNIAHISPKINTCLKITAFSPEDKNVAVVKPKQKKNIFSIKKESITSPKKGSSSHSLKDERIPQMIFKGGLLVGKDGKSISVLPKGNEGDILMISGGSPSWVPVSKLFKNIDDKEYDVPLPIPPVISNTCVSIPPEILEAHIGDEEIVYDGIYDRSVTQSSQSDQVHNFYEMSYENESPITRKRPGSGLGNALSKSGLLVFGRNKSLTKKSPAFEN